MARKPEPDDRAAAYARAVVAGEIVAGPLVRAACRRHLADLETGPARGLRWDVAAAERAFSFVETICRLNGGDFEGVPFILSPWQAFILGSLFGWLNAAGARRFRTAYIEIGKGNGKSPLAAAIGLYGLLADREDRAEIYAAATKKDQAQILFRDAVAMVDQSPALKKRLTKSGKNPVWQLTDLKTGSWFRPISSDDGQSGPRPHICLVDEVHEHKDAQVIEMLRAGFKGRRQPLMVEITNSGVTRTTICYQHHEYSQRVVDGHIPAAEADAWFAYVCALDDGDDPMADEGCWIKANPNLGVSIQPDYIRGQVAEAKGMPAKESIVRRLNFCQWVDAANPWIAQDLWRACEVPAEEWAPGDGEPVAALDLSGTKDLTALAVAWPPVAGGPVVVKVEFWTPRDTMRERSAEDRVPYDLWVTQGHITAPPGRAIDLGWVAERLGEWQQDYGLRRVAFDPYRIPYLQKELDERGIELELIPHGQGFFKAKDSGLWMPHSIEVLESWIGVAKEGAALPKPRLRVLQNPALTFASASAVLESDAKDNRVFQKRKSRGRIDGIVTLAMVAGLIDMGDAPSGVPDDYMPAVVG